MSPIAKKRRLSDRSTEPIVPQKLNTDNGESGKLALQRTDISAALEEGESKTNDFRIKIEEMLSEVRLNYTKRGALVEKLLHSVKEVIDAVPERLNQSITDIEKEMKKKKTFIPFPAPPGQVQYRFGYAKPTYMNVIGSYALQTAIKEHSQPTYIDLALTMPDSLFQEKDYLNYRYFNKRAYYLAVLAAAIRDRKTGLEGLKLSYDYLDGDHLRPILVIEPGEEFVAAKCNIRLMPVVSPDVFSLGKLLPSKNCIRSGQSDNSTIQEATPSYNASLIADTAPFSYLKLLHSSTASCTAFRDACILGRIWLRQRGFFRGGSIHSGFGHFEWSVIMALLLQGGGAGGRPLLMQGYSHYQLFRATLQFLASRDLVAQPLWINFEAPTPGEADRPVFFDGERGLNVLSKMNNWDYKLLRREAELTLQALQNTSFDQFEAVFIWRIDSYCRFDALARIPVVSDHTVSSTVDAVRSTTQYARQVYQLLGQGMGDRTTLIHISQPMLRPHGIEKSAHEKTEESLLIGFLLEPTRYRRVLDHGPPPEQKKEAASFRKFWGDKAELRRFQDGSIVETVVWKDPAQQPVHGQIVSYITERHLGSNVANSISFAGSEFDKMLPKQVAPGALPTAEFQPAMDAFDELKKNLLGLEGLPLDIKRVYPVGPALRYSIPQVSSLMLEPADTVVEFESSGRWPDDLAAIQKTKLAFLLKMAELLDSSESGVVTCVGLENENSQIMNSGFLDVIYSSLGASFRVRIFHDREALLLERKISSPTTPPPQRDEAEEALGEYRKTFVQLPRHAQDMQRLAHHYPAFSPTVRLVKKWFDAQLLSRHIEEEAMEVIVARCFVYSAPWSTPSTVMSGFLRVITFLALWDWRLDPLLVDLGSDMKRSNFEKLEETFRKARKSDPGMQRTSSMFIVSDQGIWTRAKKPVTVVAARITALAKSANEFLGSSGELPVPVMKLFRPSTKEYDFLLHLNSKVVGKATGQDNKKYKNLSSSVDPSTVDFTPVRWFVEDLERIYEDQMVLFYSDSSSVIAGIWSVNSAAARKWKVNLGYSTVVTEKNMVRLNKEAVLNEITRLGGELLQKVEVRR